jgi:hypothetical protein
MGQMPKVCIKDCDKPAFALGLCRGHYKERYVWGKHGAPQRFETCPVCCNYQYRISNGKGMCHRCTAAVAKRKNITHGNGYWDRDTCRAAGRAWYELTGRVPSETDWRAPGPRARFPGKTTVYNLFGTWSAYKSDLADILGLSIS